MPGITENNLSLKRIFCMIHTALCTKK